MTTFLLFWSKKEMGAMAEQVLATEVAEAEFQRFVDTMDLDIDPKGWDDEDKRSFDEAKRRIIRAMESGRLVIDDKGQPVFTPVHGEPITFYEPTGASFMASDQKKQSHRVGQTFLMLADLTRQSQTRFSKMVARDLKICLALLSLFLA